MDEFKIELKEMYVSEIPREFLATHTAVLQDGHAYVLARRWSADHGFSYLYEVNSRNREKGSSLNIVRHTPLLSLAKPFLDFVIVVEFGKFWERVAAEGPGVQLLIRPLSKGELLAHERQPIFMTRRTTVIRRTDFLSVTSSSLPQFLPRNPERR